MSAQSQSLSIGLSVAPDGAHIDCSRSTSISGPPSMSALDKARVEELSHEWDSLIIESLLMPANPHRSNLVREQNDMCLELEGLANKYALPATSSLSQRQRVDDMLKALCAVAHM